MANIFILSKYVWPKLQLKPAVTMHRYRSLININHSASNYYQPISNSAFFLIFFTDCVLALPENFIESSKQGLILTQKDFPVAQRNKSRTCQVFLPPRGPGLQLQLTARAKYGLKQPTYYQDQHERSEVVLGKRLIFSDPNNQSSGKVCEIPFVRLVTIVKNDSDQADSREELVAPLSLSLYHKFTSSNGESRSNTSCNFVAHLEFTVYTNLAFLY